MKRIPLVALIFGIIGGGLIAATWPRLHRASIVTHRSTINREADNAPNPTPAATRTPTATPQRRAIPTASRLVRAATATVPSPKYLVLFVLDGAQPDYYNVPGIPHIRALMRNGADFTNSFAGILESETPSGHATIASGSQPRKDGVLSFAWANGDNTTVNLFDPTAVTGGQMEKILSNAPAPNIAELVHARDRRAKVVSLGGHKYYAQDAMGGASADVISYYTGTASGAFVPVAVPGHVPPAGILSDPSLSAKTTRLPMGVEDHLTMKLVQKTFETMHPRVMLVNVPEFDWPLGHVFGADRDMKSVKALMQAFDRDLGTLEDAYRKAGILKETTFVLTSDHGFAPIYHTVNKDDIERAISSTGTRIISATYHTAGYDWISDESKAAAAAQNIAKLGNPYIQSVYFKERLAHNQFRYVRASGAERFLVPGVEAANQYLLGTFNGPSGPDIVTLFTEQSASLPGGEATWKGDHGGAAWQSQHLRIIISGAGVKKGVVSSTPTPLMDIAPTVLSIMGIAPTGMQGVSLTEGMQHATPAQLASRRAQGTELGPIVTALQAQSKAEVKIGR